jgi:hypothetical protein
MLFTLGELIIVIIAFILITYYIFSLNTCKKHKDNLDENDKDDYIEDMSGNLSNKIFIMRINEQTEYYSTFKEILDVNKYKSYNRFNILLWVPFFANDITIYESDVDNAKIMIESKNKFIQILYPKILTRSLDIIEVINKIKILFSKENTIINSCNIYINYIKTYLIQILLIYLNQVDVYELESLQRNEEKIIKIHTLLINLSNQKKSN